MAEACKLENAVAVYEEFVKENANVRLPSSMKSRNFEYMAERLKNALSDILRLATSSENMEKAVQLLMSFYPAFREVLSTAKIHALFLDKNLKLCLIVVESEYYGKRFVFFQAKYPDAKELSKVFVSVKGLEEE